MRLLLIGAFMCASLLGVAQSITITSPNGGEVWQGCTTQTITWNDSGTSDFYSIDYSINGGVNWTSIATFYNTTQGSYQWTIPNLQSTNVLVRVQDSNNSAVQDITNTAFSITAPLLLTYPNGGENVIGGESMQITWVANNTSNYYSLEYSLDAGNTWQYIDDYFYNTNGIFNWSIPNTPSTQALVRISDYNSACKTDQSDNLFTITAATPLLELTNPDPGSTFYFGKTINIQWSSYFVASNQVQLEYSANNGATWQFITTVTENDGSYSWIAPNTASSAYLIRITDLTDPSVSDTVDGTFTVAEPFIEVTYPNGGEVEAQCENFAITYSSGGTSNNRYDIFYSTDGGSSWTMIASNYLGTNYNWQYPPLDGSMLIRVEDANNSDLADESDAPFSLTTNNDIVVTSPNGGEVLEVGTSHMITWASTSPVSYVELYYSIDNGDTWVSIDSYEFSDGNYSWPVPNTPSSQCLVQVRDYNNNSCRFDNSDQVFTIAPPTPYIDLNSPGGNEGQVYYSGKNVNLSWNSDYLTSAFVSIDISYDNGGSWDNLISATEDDGSYSYTLPEIYSENCRMRVKEVGSAEEGISDFAFAVRPPFIEVTYPNGGEAEAQCENFAITYSSGGTSNNRYDIFYSIDGGSSWTMIASNYLGTNYNWQYPPLDGSMLIRVEDANNSDLADESDAPFSLTTNNDIVVTSPNGGEVLEVGTSHMITWASTSPVSYVELYYSIDNGDTWVSIDSYEFSDGNYSWPVPNNPSSQCLVQVRDYNNNSCRFDNSDQVFTIAPPTPYIDLNNPGGNEGQVYYSGKNVNLSWNSDYLTSAFVSIDISYDNGGSWDNIISATEDDGSYSYTLPEIYSENCRMRVKEVGSAVEGISEFAFAVRPPFIEVTYPNGGEVEAQCENFAITYSSGGTSNNRYDIFYSTDGGSSWTMIASNYLGTNYNWQYPPLDGSMLIRVEDANNSDLADESDAPFSLTPNNDIVVTSPNGGEVLEVGTSHMITWASTSPVSYVELYYSIDNGDTWVSIDSYEFSDGNYSWPVPNNPSSQCLVQVRDYNNNSCRFDNSDQVFTIAPPTPYIDLNSPGGNEGQVYYSGKNVNLSWNSDYLTSAFVSIDISYDNGGSWDNLISATEDDGSYSYTLPEIYSENCRMRVKEVGSAVEGISEFAFAVRPPFIEVTYPNGGEVEAQCENFAITYSSGGTSNNRYDIFYSTDGGSSWTMIASNYLGTNYNWQYPPLDGSMLIRVEDANNSDLADESDAPFSLTPNNDIVVTSPNGGEVLEVGTSHMITWASTSPVSYVELYYSIDNGDTWVSIDGYEFSDGNYSWPVPNNPSSQCLVQVRDYNNNSCRFDNSDQVFTIAPPTPYIDLNNPGGNEGQVYYSGKNVNLSWNSDYLTSAFVSIDISYDNGGSWDNLISATEDDGSYSYTLPEIYSENCRMRVKEVGSAVEGISEFAFAVRPPFIEVTYPNGGEVEAQCENFAITYSSGGTSNNRYDIFYSIDGGSSWTMIASNYLGTNYNWQYPPLDGSMLIRVEDANNSDLADESDAPFSLTPNNDIVVTSPNGGEVLEVGTSHMITWASTSPVSYVELYYSIDNGDTWVSIDGYEFSDGNYSWPVPNLPSDECLIRIQDYNNNGCRIDESDAVFSIVQPLPTVNYPNGGEIFGHFQLSSVNWTEEYFNSSFVTIEISSDNGNTWQIISSAENNDGTMLWTVPELNSNQCLVRVSSLDDPSLTDVSDAPFEITTPITVNTPNGDNGIQDWRVCTETTLTWTSLGTSNYFKIFYSADNGASWSTLESNYYSPGTTNSYDWVLPSESTPAALIRIEDRYNSAQVDTSDDTFTVAPAITITGPNGGELLTAGENVLISWLNEGATNFYTIDYSDNGGLSWNNIAFNTFLAQPEYLWTVPMTAGNDFLIRVSDHVDNCKSDISDAPFEVSMTQTASISLNSPNGGEAYQACGQTVIDWDAVNTSFYFDIAFSADGGTTWDSIVSNHYSLSGTYVWTLPNNNTNNGRIRVTDHFNVIYSDESQFDFSINAPTAEAGPNQSICQGGSAVLQASGGVAYSWSPSQGLSDPSSPNPVAAPSATTTYTVEITDGNGCSASDTVLVTVLGNCEVEGCTDTNAWNYDPQATIDNGFCLYTTNNGSTCTGDTNGDGVVNTNDLLDLLGAFGSVCD